MSAMHPSGFITFCLALLGMAASSGLQAASPEAKTVAKPALSVSAVQPQPASLAQHIAANGSLAAWQEASVGTEVNGLRLAEVRVNVGDVVQRGQELAVFASATLEADLAEARALLAEAEATLAEARNESRRAVELRATGFLSEQKVTQTLAAESSAQARVEAQRAVLRARESRLAQTRVLAPDDGVISARSATLGATLAAGQELFRLIRKGRLEWRAEVASADLARLKPGMSARVTLPGGASLNGRLRVIAPSVDAQTRNGLAYVDLPRHPAALAGMFAHGEFVLGASSGLTLPQSAVLLREGFSYVLRLTPVSGDLARVALTKVTLGRRSADRVEITAGLASDARVVARGGAFLADGDTVRVVADTAVRP